MIFQYCQFIFADVLRRRHRKYAKRHGNASFHPARMWSPVIDQRGVFFFHGAGFFLLVICKKNAQNLKK